MSGERQIFVGRTTEIQQFKNVLEEQKGQAVLVVGPAGMGKTWLINQMTQIAAGYPKLKCGCVRYEVTPTDSVDATMALMMDNAYEAAQTTEGSFAGTERRLQQWRSVLNVIKIGDLVMSLRRDPQRNTREQFLKRLNLISKKMPNNGRVIFVIDPEKYMQAESDQSWAIVVKDLPDKVKFVFAQRPEDVLVDSEVFGQATNVVRVPEGDLDVLDEEAVDELINQRVAGSALDVGKVRAVLGRYKGHPYALGAALNLIAAGTGLEELPHRPEPVKFAKVQWREVKNRGKEAIRLFKACSILETAVPDDVIEAVSELDADTRDSLLADNFLGGLLRVEADGKRIYHAILADYISGQISGAEKKGYHERAVEVYRGKLARAKKERARPDGLSAMRLAEHVLAAEGEEAFVEAVLNESGKVLKNLGLLDSCESVLERALGMVDEGSEERAMVSGNLGLVYSTRGELDKAEEMYKKALEIAEKLGLQEVMANQYGNLGNVYETRGKLDKAEDMHIKSIDIRKRLEDQEGIAAQYGNLGLIYQTRGDLDKAEEMYRKSLEISKPVGLMELTANQYGNLGVIYAERGDKAKAQQYWEKALDIFRKIGMPPEVEKTGKLIRELQL